jgi:hypothetical protein
VNVGTDHDTAAFAVESIRRWWTTAGQGAYPLARRLLVTADAGGSNGYRTRAWKAELAALAAETGLQITVCHFPPGTSKWNKVEHQLFAAITMNWRGRPLTSHEVIVNTIAATTTRVGLRVHAELDTGTTPPVSRSATDRWTPCRCAGTTGMVTGTTPCAPRHTSRSTTLLIRSTSPAPTWPGYVIRR